MKTKTTILLALLALGTSAFLVSAQDNNNDGPPGGGQGGPGQRGPGGPGMGGRPPIPAIVAALDANHDGVIDADEIANASAALKKLDKNGDGKLTRDEFMGPRPQMRGGPNGGQGRGGPGGNHPDGPPPGEGDGSNSAPPGDK